MLDVYFQIKVRRMMIEELHRLPWKMRSHLSLEHEHASVYETEVEGIKIAKCVHTARIGYYGLGRSHTHYIIGNNEKVYKTHKSALERLNALLAEKGGAE